MPPKVKALFELVSVVSGAWGLRAKFRDARANRDRLVLADSVITALGLVTGTLLAVRTLRSQRNGQQAALESSDGENR